MPKSISLYVPLPFLPLVEPLSNVFPFLICYLCLASCYCCLWLLDDDLLCLALLALNLYRLSTLNLNLTRLDQLNLWTYKIE